MRKLVLVLIILICTALAFGATAEEVIVPSTIGKLNAQITVSGSGTISGLKDGEEATIETATFQETPFQKVSNKKEELLINGNTIYPSEFEDEFGNLMLRFNVGENGNFEYIVQADIENTSEVKKMEDYKIGEAPAQVEKYTRPTEKIESDSGEIMTLSKNKIYSTNFIKSLNEAVHWTNTYVEYASGSEFRQYYLDQRSAIETLIARKGVCDEFANLGAAMLRAAKIPTRIIVGTTYDGRQWGNHAWIEAYNEKMGVWIPSDPTFNESGFVDAMHIKMGSFDDVTSSKARCTYPSSAACMLDTQKDMPQVKIINKDYFSQVKISSEDWNKLKTFEWNTLKVNLENTTQGIVTAPAAIWENYDDIKIRERKQSVLIMPGQTQTVEYKIFPAIELGANQIAKGKLTINSLAAPFKGDIVIEIGKGTDENGGVGILDVTPIAQRNTLRIVIDAQNYSMQTLKIQTQISGDGFDQNYSDSITADSEKFITKTISDYNANAYTITINTPSETYKQTIVAVKPKMAVIDTPSEPTIIEKKIDIPVEQKSTTQIALENPITILVAMLMGVAVLLLGLTLVNKKYV